MAATSAPVDVDLTANHDAEAIAIAVVFSIFSLLTVVARVVSKRMNRHNIQLDDYLLIAAWASIHLFAESAVH